MYDFQNGGKRKAGLGYNSGPREALLSTFRNPSNNSETQGAKATNNQTAKASGQVEGGLTKDDLSSCGEDEIPSFKAPSATTSLQSTRIRHRTPVPKENHNGGMDGGDDDGYVHIDSFATPVQTRTRSKALASAREDGDIVPTAWRSTKDRDDETQRMLREKNSTRVNPQHIRGANFNADSVRQTPGASWENGLGRKRPKATYKKKPVVRPRPDSQAKASSLNTDGESEDSNESQQTASKPSDAQTKSEFKDPTKLYALPAKEDIRSQARLFRNPMLVHALPAKEAEHQNENNSIDVGSSRLQTKPFQNPMEKYRSSEKESKLAEAEKSRTKAFVNPFERFEYREVEEQESQSQTDYLDDLNDEIASTKRSSNSGGSKKRKASTICPRAAAIDLSTPKSSYREKEELSSPSNDAGISIGGSQSPTIESQFPSSSSQVRHMDDISLELRETKLREQGQKRKRLETCDICVLCDAALPLGALNNWKDGDGDLLPIRMADWTEICNKHKAADLQNEWKEKGYPVIEWKGLKRRVEKNHQFLVDIIKNKVPSPFREAFARQQREIRGNAALLLRKDHQLQYPGYYGPRGSGILLHEITMRLASLVGDEGEKDGLIAQGGVAAFIQTVLVPELGVRLIMEDMNVREAKARIILDESRDIGEKLNMDEYTEDIYDEEDGPWYDVNAKSPEVVKKRGLLDAWHNNEDGDGDGDGY